MRRCSSLGEEEGFCGQSGADGWGKRHGRYSGVKLLELPASPCGAGRWGTPRVAGLGHRVYGGDRPARRISIYLNSLLSASPDGRLSFRRKTWRVAF